MSPEKYEYVIGPHEFKSKLWTEPDGSMTGCGYLVPEADRNSVQRIRPRNDNILIRLEPKRERTDSGLYLAHPPDEFTTTRVAVVIDAGPGHYSRKGKLKPMQVQRGDRVVIEAMAGKKAQDYAWDTWKPRQNDGAEIEQDLRLVRQDEVLAVVENGVLVE